MWIRIRIRIQFWIQDFDDQKLKKNYSLKNWIFLFILKIAILLSLGLQEKLSALKKEHPSLQNMEIPYFFLYL